MSIFYKTLLRPAVFLQDSEKAHSRVLRILSSLSKNKFSLSMVGALYSSPELPVNLFDIDFPNPIGVAAGMDKNGEAVPSWQSIGYGFCEIGGVTLHEQPGNPKPRMFRASKENALINRMGFNNMGAKALKKQLQFWKDRGLWPDSPLGINLGKSKVTPLQDAHLDYSSSINILWNHADFFVINVSSPNTPGLRDLQESKNLDSIINECCETNKRISAEKGISQKPLLVKIAPELGDGFLEDIIKIVEKYELSGIVATNTTVHRPKIKHKSSEKIYREEGGLSGAPLRDKSTEMIRKIFRLTNGRIPIIGVGGILTADDAWEKIKAGASLLQLYTGLVFEGPGIAKSIVKGLKKCIELEGFDSIEDAVGIEA